MVESPVPGLRQSVGDKPHKNATEVPTGIVRVSVRRESLAMNRLGTARF